MSFTTTKDRLFALYDRAGGWIARRPETVRRAIFGGFGLPMRAAYWLPGTPIRPTMTALARHTGRASPARLYREYIRQFFLGADRLERVRHGFGTEIDGLLRIPDAQRIDALLAQGGFILVLPHVHGSFAMVRGFAGRYPVLSLVRLSTNAARADASRALYAQVQGDILDVRNSEPTVVARTLLRTLRKGKIVVGTVDRIGPAPGPEGSDEDKLPVTAFGETVGAPGWPARFAQKARVPILPAMVSQSEKAVVLHLGATIEPTDDLIEMTQSWMREFEALFRTYPQEWAFCLDKHWSRVLRSNPPASGATQQDPLSAPSERS